MVLALVVCLVASALYSGSETAFYSLSKVQLDLDAERGSRAARWVRWLSKDDAGLLIMVLIGNNLAIELATLVGESLGRHAGWSPAVATLAVGFWLTPVAFFVAEVLPKEMFRRRPHGLLPIAVPLLVASRVLFWPLERVLRGVTYLVEMMFGVQHNTVAVLRGRERWLARFEEGRRAGALPERTYRLVHNALALRSTPVARAMVPWSQVVKLDIDGDPEARNERLRSSRYSRLPVVDRAGTVRGYLHQVDVLARWAGEGRQSGLRALSDAAEEPAGEGTAADLAGLVLDVAALAPDTSVSQALLLMRGSGKRAAVVGTLEKPLGWVTLKDLVEELTGDLVGL
ncbi:MAG: DUF21 domain-containing protein [Planctomycetes bacterium]|nr:DUF21 domain-containing protein [Planctomycetota bacterium]